MDYNDLLAYCKRAAGIQSAPDNMTLLDIVGCLHMTSPVNRAINAEVLARFMAEYIEATHVPVTAVKH